MRQFGTKSQRCFLIFLIFVQKTNENSQFSLNDKLFLLNV